MSVVFDVLDSLNAIHNVEDLKKRWAEDCKRPQTQSYKAVEMFVGFFDNYSSNDCLLFILRVANFTMRYREAVATHICPIDEQIWIMPYIRYAERLKAFVSYHRDFAFIPDDFAKKCYDNLHNAHSYLDAYYHVAFTRDYLAVYQKNPQNVKAQRDVLDGFGRLYSIVMEGSEPDQAFCDLINIFVPWWSSEDASIHNPWGLNPDPNKCTYDMSDIEAQNMATICPYFGCDLLNREFYPESGSLESHLDELISYFDNCDDIKSNELAQEISRLTESNLDFELCSEVIKNICKDKLPWQFEIILRYDIENIFVCYLKQELQRSMAENKMDLLFDRVRLLESILPEDLLRYCYTKLFSDSVYEAAIRASERKKVLFEMSHTIKNLVGSVSAPLYTLQEQLTGSQRRTIDNALAGANLIRDLAVGVHMSMRGECGAWRKDVAAPEFGAITLDKIILEALRYAVNNMFDGKYFAQFVKNYFSSDLDTFIQAQNEWNAADTSEGIFNCIRKYFFDFQLDCHDSDLNIPIGDKEGTAAKFLIFFQELFLNAVKYCSSTERAKRFVKMDIFITPDKWEIILANSATEYDNSRSSGIGLAVIKNFATLFEASYHAKYSDGIYSSNIKFLLTEEA